MKTVSIYQTLEDRGNYDEVESHGPFFCSKTDKNGNHKSGAREPWLGEGYYFWDTFISDAHWWGNSIYSKKGRDYIICETTYDQHSPLLFDTVSDPSLLYELIDCAKIIQKKWNMNKVSVPLIMDYLRGREDFKYKAIRVCPQPKRSRLIDRISFPGDMFVLGKIEKIQICFFDKTLLVNPFKIVYSQQIPDDFTI